LGKAVLARVPDGFGGSGDIGLLYFFVRVLKHEVVLEAGVSVGFSSHAILHALRGNRSGTAHSSDSPYPFIKDAHRYVGAAA
jgi:predicted O-methyltransferase YrrM